MDSQPVIKDEKKHQQFYVESEGSENKAIKCRKKHDKQKNKNSFLKKVQKYILQKYYIVNISKRKI